MLWRDTISGKEKDRQIANYYEKIRQSKTGEVVP